MSTIILFRTEDLKVNSPDAYQPILSEEELLQTFTPEQLDVINQTNIATDAPLPFDEPQLGPVDLVSTANDIYRISTRNYRLKEDAKIFTEERFGSFFKGGTTPPRS